MPHPSRQRRLLKSAFVMSLALLGWALSGCGGRAQAEPMMPMDGPPTDHIPWELSSRQARLASAEVEPRQDEGATAPVETLPSTAGHEEPGDIEPERGLEDDAEVEDTDPSALTDFDEHLRPYGEWVEHPTYGTVWVPYPSVVGTQFAPYVSRGHWALTPGNQWIWVSDYPFGWVTFHYGRWVWGQNSGWMWIPGRRYAPAWVTFSVSDDPYIGWAPMPPRYVWRAGVAVWVGTVPLAPYVYVPLSYAFYPSVYSYVVYQPARVRWIASRCRRYRPRGAPFGYYYSPPIERIPARARPTGRVPADARSLSLQRYRSTPQRAILSTAGAQALPAGQHRTLRQAQRASSTIQQVSRTSATSSPARGDIAATQPAAGRLYRAGHSQRTPVQSSQRREIAAQQRPVGAAERSSRRTTTRRASNAKAPAQVERTRVGRGPTSNGARPELAPASAKRPGSRNTDARNTRRPAAGHPGKKSERSPQADRRAPNRRAGAPQPGAAADSDKAPKRKKETKERTSPRKSPGGRKDAAPPRATSPRRLAPSRIAPAGGSPRRSAAPRRRMGSGR